MTSLDLSDLLRGNIRGHRLKDKLRAPVDSVAVKFKSRAEILSRLSVCVSVCPKPTHRTFPPGCGSLSMSIIETRGGGGGDLLIAQPLDVASFCENLL